MTPADAWVAEDPTLCDVCGRESCEDHLPPNDDAPRAPQLVAIRARDVMSAPSPKEIVESMLWADCISLLASESGAGKTFVGIDLGGAVSDGVPWHGRLTVPGSVVYLPFEGAIGVRLRALHSVAGRRLEHFYVIEARDPISTIVTRDGEHRSIGELAICSTLETLRHDLARAGRPPIVAGFIDTARASMTGSEDSSEHVSAYLRAVRRMMATVPGAATLIVHHAGWQDGESQRRRERGSSAWRGNVDATLYLEAGHYDRARGEAALTLRTLKVREGECPAPLRLIRRRVELLEMNPRGDRVTSCIIEPDRRTREDREAEAAAATNEEQRAVDVRTLRAVLEHPEATSYDRLRIVLGARKTAVSDSISRLVRNGWVQLPERQRQPYIVTTAGRAALEGV